jgi:hypothetical protein
MKFVALFDLRKDITHGKLAEVIARRAEFKFPDGLKLVSEYWSPASSPAVIATFEASDPALLLQNSIAWLDAFEVKVIPVVDWEEGEKKLAKSFPRK